MKQADLIQQLGSKALGSRLRRLSDRLYRDVSRLYEAEGLAFEARWFPVIYALSLRKRMAITQIAEELGLTHPAINQTAASMTERGLVKSTRDPHDDRRRLLELTASGRKLVERLKPVWTAVEAATNELLAETSLPVLEALTTIEAALDSRDMQARALDRLPGRKRSGNDTEIVDYQPSYRKWFRRLNEAWLIEHFEIEPEDERLLADPNRRILKKGGHILFARRGDDVVGTLALVRHNESKRVMELIKMAVAKPEQNRGTGRKLLRAAIDRARKEGAEAIVLDTSPRLKAACHLYESAGFRIQQRPAHNRNYRRKTIQMRLEL